MPSRCGRKLRELRLLFPVVTSERKNSSSRKLNHEKQTNENKIQICSWHGRSFDQQGSLFGSGHSDLLQRLGAEPVCVGGRLRRWQDLEIYLGRSAKHLCLGIE